MGWIRKLASVYIVEKQNKQKTIPVKELTKKNF